MGRTISLEDIGERSAADFLREVARAHEPLRVVLDDGESVDIGPSSAPLADLEETGLTLKPLPQFEGTIPAGWKDAIYDFSESEL